MTNEKRDRFALSGTALAVIAIVILMAMILVAGQLFTPQLQEPKLTFNEEPIEKNTEFQLKPGEQYVYAYHFNDTQINITYSVLQGTGCTLIRLDEHLNSPSACLDRWGNDKHGYDSALEEPAILFFKPWMLALKDNWRWNSSMYLSFDGEAAKVAETYYRVMRSEIYGGRPAYVVEITSESGPAEYEWIDAEKRILLRSEGPGYVLELVGGLD